MIKIVGLVRVSMYWPSVCSPDGEQGPAFSVPFALEVRGEEFCLVGVGVRPGICPAGVGVDVLPFLVGVGVIPLNFAPSTSTGLSKGV